jgi:hypothetical protein
MGNASFLIEFARNQSIVNIIAFYRFTVNCGGRADAGIVARVVKPGLML